MAANTNLKSIKAGGFSTQLGGFYVMGEAIASDGNAINITSANNITTTIPARKFTWNSSTGTFQLTISELNIEGGAASTLPTQFDTGKYVLVVTEYV